jgi:L-aspartate oxidase
MEHLPADFVRSRFPTIARACAEAGLDLTCEPIPVSPAAHYIMGGVETDLDGRTSLAGLFAAGEVACTGVHGANRLASNSLLEGLVFGARAAMAMTGVLRPAALSSSEVVEDLLGDAPSGANHGPVPSLHAIQDLMWRDVGVLRTQPALAQAVAQLHRWVDAIDACRRDHAHDHALRRVGSLATAGLLIARAAVRRTESRGAHFRTDFPLRDDLHWKRHIAERRHVH